MDGKRIASVKTSTKEDYEKALEIHQSLGSTTLFKGG